MSDFNKPLDEWVEEEVKVPSYEVKFDKGKPTHIEETEVTRKIKTIYTKVVPVKMSCKDMKHNWYMLDKRKHIAACTNCIKHRYLRAIYETIKDGKIIDRDTGEQFD